jgi:hypothetical protein
MPENPEYDSLQNAKMTRSAWWLSRDTRDIALPESDPDLASAKTMSTDGSGGIGCVGQTLLDSPHP